MAYNRYARIKSLPGADGKMPRPFRVDEDWNVIYLDEEQDAAGPTGRGKPSELARAGIMEWDELDRRLDEERGFFGRWTADKPVELAETGNLDWNGYQAMRAQGQRDAQSLKDYTGRYTNSDGQGALIGGATRAARVLEKTAKVRDQYGTEVRKLDPFDYDGREALKGHWRRPMPPETRSILEKVRPGKGRRVGSEGRANITNSKVDDTTRVIRRIGRGAGVAGAGLAVADIATADDPWRAAAANAGAVIGGLGGGVGGAFLGGFTGPGAFVATPTLGAAGAIGGGELGYEVGEELYDFLRKHLSRR